MNSILRHSAAALVAATLLTIGLVGYAMHKGMDPVLIVVLAGVGGTIVGACLTGSAFAFAEHRNQQLAETVGAKLARSLAMHAPVAAGLESNIILMPVQGEDRPLARAA